MTDYPKEPAMLASWLNMKLRDFYHLESLCEDLEIERADLEKRLGEAGFEYNADLNKVW